MQAKLDSSDHGYGKGMTAQWEQKLRLLCKSFSQMPKAKGQKYHLDPTGEAERSLSSLGLSILLFDQSTSSQWVCERLSLIANSYSYLQS